MPEGSGEPFLAARWPAGIDWSVERPTHGGRAAGGPFMARCCAFTLLAVAVAGLTADFTPAQPPNKAVKWKQFDPAKGVPVQPGGRIIIIPSVVDEEQIPDWRLVLAGLVPKNKPPTLDPKLMKELMDNLPKDQKADEKQIQDILKNHPELKNPAFLQQLGQMKQDPSF